MHQKESRRDCEEKVVAAHHRHRDSLSVRIERERSERGIDWIQGEASCVNIWLKLLFSLAFALCFCFLNLLLKFLLPPNVTLPRFASVNPDIFIRTYSLLSFLLLGKVLTACLMEKKIERNRDGQHVDRWMDYYERRKGCTNAGNCKKSIHMEEEKEE